MPYGLLVMRLLPSANRIRRFDEDLLALIGGESARLGLAVSGGPDSVAMLLLANAARPGAVAAATVDHGLRAESAAEAEFVSGLCRDISVPHATLRPATPITGSVQAEARRERYALLDDWRRRNGLDWVLTAHHADDQAETLLMRLQRGTGVGGLSGIRKISGRVVRPLLGWRRAELEEIVRVAEVDAVVDPSNLDERFDRARLRRRLGEADWIEPLALARSAHALAEADAALEWCAEREEQERAPAGRLSLDATGLPPELRRRLLLRMIRRVNPDAAPRGEELTRLLRTVDSGGTATLADVKCQGGASWRFEAAPPRRSA